MILLPATGNVGYVPTAIECLIIPFSGEIRVAADEDRPRDSWHARQPYAFNNIHRVGLNHLQLFFRELPVVDVRSC